MYRAPDLMIAVVTAILIVGCSTPAAPSASPANSGTTAPAPDVSALASPVVADPSPEPTPAAVDEGTFKPGDVVEVIVDRLRIRSAPRVADDSRLLEPLLGDLQKLYVYEGPVEASGYTWLHVLPFDARFNDGWVAIASRDGVPWVRHDQGGCDTMGPTVTNIGNATAGVRLGCWATGDLTMAARIVPCNADIDGPSVEPAWFTVGVDLPMGGETICPALVEPYETETGDRKFLVAFDPNGAFRDPLMIDTPLEVTGRFDHPAAKTCTGSGFEGEVFDAVLACRATFVVTAVRTLA